MYILLLILVTIIWGTTFVVIKDTVASVDPFFIVFLRMAIASAVMFVVLAFKDRKLLTNSKAMRNGTILGVFLATAFSAQTIGLQFTTSGHSGFITGTEVVLIPFFLYAIFRQKLKNHDVFAALLALLGLFFLTYSLGQPINSGDLITLITAICGASLVILTGRFVKNTKILPMIFYQFLSAGIVALAIFVATNESIPTLELKPIAAIGYLGLVGTLFTYFVVAVAQKHVKPVAVGIIFSLQAVFAAIFGYFFLTEIMNIKELFGAFLILASVIFHQIQSNKKLKESF